MTYTSHGHHVDGTILDVSETRPRIMRCGGPGLCGKCSAEASRILNKLRLIEATEISQQWRTKSIGVEALYWDGTPEMADKVIAWFATRVGTARFTGDEIYIQVVNDHFRIPPEYWMVFHGGVQFTIHSDGEFRNLYEMDA